MTHSTRNTPNDQPRSADPRDRKLREIFAEHGVAEALDPRRGEIREPDEDTRAREAARGLGAMAAIMSAGHESGGVRGDDVSRLAGEAARGRRGLARAADKKRRQKAQRGADGARRTRSERASARRAAFIASMKARAAARGLACDCAPRDWVDPVYRTIRPIVKGDAPGRRARDLCLSAGMPREIARILRAAALDVRRDADGSLRPHRAWGSIVARRFVVYGWAIWRMRARTSAHGFGDVTAGISIGMIGALFPNLLDGDEDGGDKPVSRQWVSEIVSELAARGFFVRRQPPPELRHKMPAYFGPSGYGFNTYWFRATGDDDADDDPELEELDAAIDGAPLTRRALALAAAEPPPL